MALNIKNPEVVQLAAEVARMAGETKTEAIRQALIERKVRLLASGGHGNRKESLIEYMAREVWPHIPPGARNRISRSDGSSFRELHFSGMPEAKVRKRCYTGTDMACKTKSKAPAKKGPAKKSGK